MRSFYPQIPGHLVPAQVSDHHSTRSVHHRHHLAGVDHDYHTVGTVLRHGGHIQGRPKPGTVPGGVAGLPGRQPVLPAGQPGPVLRGAHGGHIAVLRDDLGEGVAADHTHRQQVRSHGAHPATEQGEGGEDAGHGGGAVRRVLAAAVRDIRPDQAGRPAGAVGGGLPSGGHADRAVAGRVQQLHQSGAVRVLQPEVPARLHRRAPEPPVLRHPAVQREPAALGVGQRQRRRQGVVVLHNQSSRVHQTAVQPGDERVVHIQRLNAP